jgi:exoribonuclease R
VPFTRVAASAVTGELATRFAAIRSELKLSESFPPEVDAEAERAAQEPTLPALELLDIPFITIDPPGSTDLDQALHLERAGEGYRVFYAIADVPAFVVQGGAVDLEARRRGQTMYAPDRRIPLHPVVLSENAASLLPNRRRPAFVWTFELDAAAEVTAVTLRRALVQSRRQADYAGVQAELDAGTASEALQLLREVGLGRIALERARGGASLNRPEVEVEQRDGAYRLVRRASLPVEDWNAQLSLMTGMAAAQIMIDGRVGILRTMPAPDAETIARFRLQVAALGCPWPQEQPYGEFLRTLDPDRPLDLAAIHAASSLFRGAGYTAFDGEVPSGLEQAAVAASYTHATAPLRRLIDRFVLLVCAGLVSGQRPPAWVVEALPALPGIMASSDGIASRLDREAVNAVEAAVLHGRVGEVFAATVIAARAERGTIQLTDPAVTADCDGVLTAGSEVRVRLVTADVASGTVLFSLA